MKESLARARRELVFFAIWKLINEMRCETKRKKLYRRHKIKISISEKLFIGIKNLKLKEWRVIS